MQRGVQYQQHNIAVEQDSLQQRSFQIVHSADLIEHKH